MGSKHCKIKPKKKRPVFMAQYILQRKSIFPIIALLDRANFNKFQLSFTFLGIYMDKISPYT